MIQGTPYHVQKVVIYHTGYRHPVHYLYEAQLFVSLFCNLVYVNCRTRSTDLPYRLTGAGLPGIIDEIIKFFFLGSPSSQDGRNEQFFS